MSNSARKAKLWPWGLASTIVLLTVFVAAYAYSVGITNRDLKARLTRAVLQQKERDHEAAAAFVDQERRAKEEARQEVATELEELTESNRELKEINQDLKARLSQAASNAKPSEKRDAEKTRVRTTKSWSGRGMKNTEPFTVSSPWIISWSCTGGEHGFGSLGIIVYRAGSNRLVNVAANVMGADEGRTWIYESGQFYLQIIAANCSWAVAVSGSDKRTGR